MFIVQVSPEMAPVAKVGGLADVVFGLSRELEVRGNDVEIILPKYDCMRYDHIFDLHADFHDLWVPWGGDTIHCTVLFGFVHGRKCFFIEPHSDDKFFERGCFYGQHDDPLRYAFFSKAALEFLLHSGKRPDVIHTHDWQTGLLPVMLFDQYQHGGMETQRVCHTIHNFSHQGLTGEEVLHGTGLSNVEYYLDRGRLGDDVLPGAVNLLKGAIVYANYVGTVSPTHAWEARHTEQGEGLQQILNEHHEKFGGILNGLDYDTWNPGWDPYIAEHYNVETVDAKFANKAALRERLLLDDDYAPIIAYVGRLDRQKGVHLIQHAIHYSLHESAQFVLLGSAPDPDTHGEFERIKAEHNENPNCHLELGFSEELAHLIYAGADMVVVPSMFEPCGLAQLIGMRYGTVPVVRAVGGLNDTVFDYDFSAKPPEERTGFIFEGADPMGLETALHRAIRVWYDHPDGFRALMVNGMRQDYSWNHPGQHYMNVYEFIRHK